MPNVSTNGHRNVCRKSRVGETVKVKPLTREQFLDEYKRLCDLSNKAFHDFWSAPKSRDLWNKYIELATEARRVLQLAKGATAVAESDEDDTEVEP